MLCRTFNWTVRGYDDNNEVILILLIYKYKYLYKYLAFIQNSFFLINALNYYYFRIDNNWHNFMCWWNKKYLFRQYRYLDNCLSISNYLINYPLYNINYPESCLRTLSLKSFVRKNRSATSRRYEQCRSM